MNVLTRVSRFLFNLLNNLCALVFLSLSELIDFLELCGLAGIDEAEVTHVKHELAMSEQVFAEAILKHEKTLIKLVEGLHLVLLLDGFLPHSHEFPALELLEEGEILDMVVGVALNEPLAERHELHWLVVLVEGQTLA